MTEPTGSKPRPAHLPQDRVVAFIDILGFRNLIGQMARDAELFRVVRDSLARLGEEQIKYRELARRDAGDAPDALISFQGIEQAHFSDSVVLSQPLAEANPRLAARMITWHARSLAGDLLKAGILVRGGISVGWTFHERNVLFGDGIVAAYELESRVAHVPRILVDDKLVAMLPEVEVRGRLIKLDSDGFWYINPLGELWFGDQVAIPDADQFAALRRVLVSGLDATRTRSLDVFAKYRWLAREFNEEVEASKWAPRMAEISPIEA